MENINFKILFLSIISILIFLKAPSQRPNIVLIVSDDHGTDAIGCYGNPIIKTPALDHLAADGVRFSHAFATTASCSPSRSVILTGLHNHYNGMYGLEHEENHFSSFNYITSLPKLLKQGGYRTARIGKYHLAPETVYNFDTVLVHGKANDNSSIARDPVRMAELCRSFLKQKTQPFFLYFATDDPHRSLPFETFPLPNNFGNREIPYFEVKEIVYPPNRVVVPPFLPDNVATRAELANYYQAVSRMDQGIGRLIQILKEYNQYHNTIIIYLSDNGIAFPGSKTTLYDAGIQLPLIMRLPNMKNRGIVTDAMVSWADITPTLLDLAGIDYDTRGMHGRSFKEIFVDAQAFSADTVFASHTFHQVDMYYPMRAIRTRDYKLIWNLAHESKFPLARDIFFSLTWQHVIKNNYEKFGKRTLKQLLYRPEFELYDLRNDPDEIHNLADDPRYYEIKTHLLHELKNFQIRTKDPWLRRWVIN